MRMTHKRGAPKGNASFFFSDVASGMKDNLQEKLLQNNCYEVQSLKGTQMFKQAVFKVRKIQSKTFYAKNEADFFL